MEAKRPKWLAVGKEKGGLETKSQSVFAQGRVHSQSHKNLTGSESQLREKCLTGLVRNKSAISLISQEAMV
jgi:hypothetical protein